LPARHGEKKERGNGRKARPDKGRIKEEAGAVADDDNLKKEGNLDQAVGKAKEKSGAGDG
jgi:uncharacterized protein YjbJ (UPF0337 family)